MATREGQAKKEPVNESNLVSRVSSLEQSLEDTNSKLDMFIIEQRSINARIDARFDRVDARLDRLEKDNSEIKARFDRFEMVTAARFDRLENLIM